MPPAKPQGTTVAVGKTNLAKRPAPTPGEQGRRKAAKRSGRTSPGTPGMLPASAAPATPSRGGGHCPTLRGGRRGGNAPLYVSVFFWDGRSLMSWHPARACELARRGRAVRRFSKGVLYVQLPDRTDGELQPVACGIDPGSRREGYTVASRCHMYLNIDADAVTYVRDAVATRHQRRRSRTTPRRAPQATQARGGILPSPRARWLWTLCSVDRLRWLYPLSTFAVEHIAAETRGQRRWDAFFSPLEGGKRWFYAEFRLRGDLATRTGWETPALRRAWGLATSRGKSTETFWAHCVGSGTLAASPVGGMVPEPPVVLRLSPVWLPRRHLHRLELAWGEARRPFGGPRSLGLKRGSRVLHPRFGMASAGGTMGGHISLHDFATGSRLTRRAGPPECTALAYNAWRVRLLGLKSGASGAGVFL
jgi:hypothetical protein